MFQAAPTRPPVPRTNHAARARPPSDPPTCRRDASSRRHHQPSPRGETSPPDPQRGWRARRHCDATPGDDGRRLRRRCRAATPEVAPLGGPAVARGRRRCIHTVAPPLEAAAALSGPRRFSSSPTVSPRGSGAALRVSLDGGKEVRISDDQPGGEKSLFSLLFSANRLTSPYSG